MAQLAHYPVLRTRSFTFCAALFVLGGASCGSSAGTSTPGGSAGSEQGGSAGQPSGTAGGAAQAGSSGNTAGNTGGAGNTSSAGNAGARATCPAATKSGNECSAVDSVCASAEACCDCIDFPGGGCGHLWSCAVPKNNAVDCPATAPALGSACPTLKLSCQYCGANGPELRTCSNAPDRSAPPEWSEFMGIQCSN